MSNTLSDISIVHQIAITTTNYLQLELQDLVDRRDETRGGLVRMGLLQDSPVKYGINILTQFNDPDEPNSWRHSLISSEESHKLGMHVPTYEVGGGQIWFRRYTTRLTLFFKPGGTRLEAEELSSIILSRAEQSILTSPLPQGGDSFGEYALQNLVDSDVNIEGGGPGQFIYNGMIWWCCLTEKSKTFNG